MSKLNNYVHAAISELHRVSWPTRQQAFRISIIVLAVTFAFALIFGFFDTFLAWGYKEILKLAAS